VFGSLKFPNPSPIDKHGSLPLPNRLIVVEVDLTPIILLPDSGHVLPWNSALEGYLRLMGIRVHPAHSLVDIHPPRCPTNLVHISLPGVGGECGSSLCMPGRRHEVTGGVVFDVISKVCPPIRVTGIKPTSLFDLSGRPRIAPIHSFWASGVVDQDRCS